VLAGTKPSLNGALEFYDVDDQTSLTTNLQHQLCSHVEWDPTGRYVVTYVANMKSKMENGYKMWTFYGAECCKEERKNVLHQFSWRPRPPTFLPIEEQERLKKKEVFKEFRDKYKKEDRSKREEELRVRTEKREEQRRKYIDFMRKRIEENTENSFYLQEDEEEIEIEEIVVEVLETTEEVITE